MRRETMRARMVKKPCPDGLSRPKVRLCWWSATVAGTRRLRPARTHVAYRVRVSGGGAVGARVILNGSMTIALIRLATRELVDGTFNT